ncbi:hypothetical protein [Desulfosarcina sp.]|uniref:hypothetical protein n=1 Tax=Desulfosarcina sp. TaxID=2027861 RepID=UPI0029B99B4D|nr:hypothetical protein [Desulfosarcina sp.]MDX2451571.1 hypothetical protein [Desulfosarcina sp.]MDX2489374.1 hypothetical protein [Desulfosarcina sp.]
MQKNSRLNLRAIIAAALFAAVLITMGCTQKMDHTKGVYMLVDTSGTYTEELNKARTIINYLLGSLAPGDTMAVARIDTGSFSEKDIVAKVTFDQRPSVANTQKRAFQKQVADFVSSVAGSSHTDISGGLLQAVEYLNEAGSGQKYILIFSDLKEELARGHVRDVPFRLEGFNIIALNVTKLRDDIRDPKNYMQRVDQWRDKAESGGGAWRVINDLERLDNMFSL